MKIKNTQAKMEKKLKELLFVLTVLTVPVISDLCSCNMYVCNDFFGVKYSH